MQHFFKTVLAGLSLFIAMPLLADCKSESAELLKALQADVLSSLTTEQQQQAAAIIEQRCVERVATEKAKKKDAFTELFLSGESGDKPGNKRLERRSR